MSGLSVQFGEPGAIISPSPSVKHLLLMQASDRNEVSAVAIIAYMDCMATLLQGCLMLMGVQGAHHTINHPYWHGGVTILFGLVLLAIAIKMTLTCSAEKALADPQITYYSYHICETQVSGAAYALAFLSILRQVVVTLLDSFLRLPGYRLEHNGHHSLSAPSLSLQALSWKRESAGAMQRAARGGSSSGSHAETLSNAAGEGASSESAISARRQNFQRSRSSPSPAPALLPSQSQDPG
jgi:hypothetical protein